MKVISATENAWEDGHDCAVEWRGDTVPPETIMEWRARCRATIVREFEGGGRCALCPAGSTRDEFLQLLAEWERGFDVGIIGAKPHTSSAIASSRAGSVGGGK